MFYYVGIRGDVKAWCADLVICNNKNDLNDLKIYALIHLFLFSDIVWY